MSPSPEFCPSVDVKAWPVRIDHLLPIMDNMQLTVNILSARAGFYNS